MTKGSTARDARRCHDTEALAIRFCPNCNSYIILRGRMGQVGAHDTPEQAAAAAQEVVEAQQALSGDFHVMLLEIGAPGEFGHLPCPYDAPQS